MTDNLRHWNVLGRTDPKHTKPFSRAGGFKGTATKPIWLTMRLTEHFGPCGIGWGMTEPRFRVVPAGEEILVFCTVGLWYVENSVRSETVFGVGGDKAVGKNKNGAFTDDEAFKKAYTDALSNAMKQIGAAADVHMGLFEDNKYVREVREEFAQAENGHAAPKPDDNPDIADARTRYGRVLKQIHAAATPERCDEVVRQEKADIAFIRKIVGEEAALKLMGEAEKRKRDLEGARMQ